MPALVELPAWPDLAVKPVPWRIELELGEGILLRVR